MGRQEPHPRALTHVRGATADPGMVHEPKGLRAPGLHIPGAAVIGTFHHAGERYFWDVRSGAHAVVIELVEQDYARLTIDVEDAARVDSSCASSR